MKRQRLSYIYIYIYGFFFFVFVTIPVQQQLLQRQPPLPPICKAWSFSCPWVDVNKDDGLEYKVKALELGRRATSLRAGHTLLSLLLPHFPSHISPLLLGGRNTKIKVLGQTSRKRIQWILNKQLHSSFTENGQDDETPSLERFTQINDLEFTLSTQILFNLPNLLYVYFQSKMILWRFLVSKQQWIPFIFSLFIYLYSFVILCCKEKNNTGFEKHEAE